MVTKGWELKRTSIVSYLEAVMAEWFRELVV